MNYYEKELSRLQTNGNYPVNIRLTDGRGEQTKYMDLNAESVPVLIKWLTENYIKGTPFIDKLEALHGIKINRDIVLKIEGMEFPIEEYFSSNVDSPMVFELDNIKLVSNLRVGFSTSLDFGIVEITRIR